MPWRWFAVVAVVIAQTACFEQRGADRPSPPQTTSPPRERAELASTRRIQRLPRWEREPVSRKVPWINPALAIRAPAHAFAAYRFLLVEPSLALGDRCGLDVQETELWQALTRLVRTQETEMLSDLALRASTLEARAAAIVGLVKIGVVAEPEAKVMLASLEGTVTTCSGCIFEGGAPSEVAGFFRTPLSDEVWDISGLDVVELPGAVAPLPP